MSYEALAAIGSGLGSAGFIVFDDADDLVAVAAGVARFLAVESCGQCTPCKLDGLRIADLLAATARGDGRRAATSTSCAGGSRPWPTARAARWRRSSRSSPRACSSTSRRRRRARRRGPRRRPSPRLVAELVDIDDGEARIDEHHADKQPDWTYDAVDSGADPGRRGSASTAIRSRSRSSGVQVSV